MSAPIPIKQKENPDGYFYSWFPIKQKEDLSKLEEDIFSMDDDEPLPKLVSTPPSEEDLNYGYASGEEEEEEEDGQSENCYGYPCSNITYFGHCKKCETPICPLVTESMKQGFQDMKYDFQTLWEKDVVKLWTSLIC